MRLPGVILGSILLAIAFSGGLGAFEPDDSTNPVVAKFLDASKIQQEAMRGVQMEVDISAQLPKLKEQGRWRLLRTIPWVGKTTFKKLSDFVGDRTVQHEVIERYLQLETDTPAEASIAITPVNYKFRLKTKMTLGENRTFVFELTPKKKAVGLFKGELWLDADTGMPLREAGTLVKTPSIFLKKIAFVNEYQLQNGVSLPSHIECHVDTHIAGRADLDIRFSKITQSSGDQQAEIARP